VASAIPTLLLAGQYDQLTPPANALLAAHSLSHSYTFTFPGRGHGLLYSLDACPTAIFQSFLDHPTRKPASACLASMTAPQFDVSPGNPPFVHS
jgi:pimeloyl-ACP methyl ester carboxylesterase